MGNLVWKIGKTVADKTQRKCRSEEMRSGGKKMAERLTYLEQAAAVMT